MTSPMAHRAPPHATMAACVEMRVAARRRGPVDRGPRRRRRGAGRTGRAGRRGRGAEDPASRSWHRTGPGERRGSPVTAPRRPARSRARRATAPGEVVAPLGVGPVPVERRACRRQHHRVAGVRPRPRPRSTASAMDCARSPAPGRRRRRPPRRRPPRWRTTPRSRGRPRAASTDRSRPLLRPPAMSTAGVEPCEGGQHRPGRGRLGVVVEPHPVSLAHQLDAVGEPTECEQRLPQPSGLAPAAAAVARAHSGVDQVVGHAPGQLVHRRPPSRRSGPTSAPSRQV